MPGVSLAAASVRGHIRGHAASFSLVSACPVQVGTSGAEGDSDNGRPQSCENKAGPRNTLPYPRFLYSYKRLANKRSRPAAQRHRSGRGAPRGLACPRERQRPHPHSTERNAPIPPSAGRPSSASAAPRSAPVAPGPWVLAEPAPPTCCFPQITSVFGISEFLRVPFTFYCVTGRD